MFSPLKFLNKKKKRWIPTCHFLNSPWGCHGCAHSWRKKFVTKHTLGVRTRLSNTSTERHSLTASLAFTWGRRSWHKTESKRGTFLFKPATPPPPPPKQKQKERAVSINCKQIGSTGAFTVQRKRGHLQFEGNPFPEKYSRLCDVLLRIATVYHITKSPDFCTWLRCVFIRYYLVLVLCFSLCRSEECSGLYSESTGSMFSRVSVATPIFIITFDSFQLNCDLVVVNVLACFKARNQIDGPMRNGYWKEKI